jgi:hypothetical protein
MPQDTVTHRIKSVRRHYIDVATPPPPPPDSEAFVIRVSPRRSNGEAELALTPADFVQYINCLLETKNRVMGGADE